VAISRHTISIDGEVAKAGLKRAKAMGYKKFSPYVEHLIREDVEKRPAHVTVREEPENYLHSKKKPRGSSAA
jgi:hypothetical protein